MLNLAANTKIIGKIINVNDLFIFAKNFFNNAQKNTVNKAGKFCARNTRKRKLPEKKIILFFIEKKKL
jgi:hypothetical protein